MRRFAFLLLLSLAVPVGLNAKDPSKTQQPIVWGTLRGNTGCVIFQEGHKTTGKFWGVAITTKTVGKLAVIETQNYSLGEKEVLETQENMDKLTQQAETDHVKLVRIPEKSPENMLEKARAICKQDL
jgi:hypothetical protein